MSVLITTFTTFFRLFRKFDDVSTTWKGLFRKFDDVSTTWKDPQHIGLKMFYRWQVSGSPPLPFAGVAARAFGTRAEENRAFRQPDFYRCRDNAPLGLVSGLQDTFKPNSQ